MIAKPFGPSRSLAASIVVGLLALAASAYIRAQNDPSAVSAAVGRILPASSAMPLIGVAAADQPAVKASAEKIWAIVLRNPVLNPPHGFSIEPSFVAHGYVRPGAPAGAPYSWTVGGYIHWYYFDEVAKSVKQLPVSDHAFWVHANRLSVAFAGTTAYTSDAAGDMYWEPREMGRVGGYPQYENGAIVITSGSEPVWKPVPRERLLQLEIATQRRVLESATALAEQYAKQGGIVARQTEESRLRSDDCVRYLEAEFARLSPAERSAPGYVGSAGGRVKLPKVGCSAVVDADFPDAHRVVAVNTDFYDRRLPRTAVQVVIIDFSNFMGARFDRAGWRRRAYEGLRDGMDYEALAALMR